MELRSYIDAKRSRDVQKQAGATDVPMPVMSKELRSLYETASNNNGTPESLLEDLQELLKKAPSVHVLLAATPSAELKEQITNWFRTQVAANMLITFTVRRDLGGGVMVRAGSHIYDFTFRKKILDHKQRLTEMA